MKNITTKVEGHILTITVDLSQNHGESGSGKSIVIGTTEGNHDVPGAPGVKFGLNIYRPRQRAAVQ